MERRSFLKATAGTPLVIGSAAACTESWNPNKHPSNPIISGTSIQQNQAYPPAPIRVNSSYYLAAKSYPNIVGFSSTDGVNWSEQSPNFVGRNDFPGENLRKAGAPAMFYDRARSVTHLYHFVKTKNEWYINHTAQSPTKPYELSGEPFLTLDDMDTAFGLNAQSVTLTDVVKQDGQFRYFGNVYGNKTAIWTGWGNTPGAIELDKILFTSGDVSRPGSWVGTPSVIRASGGYWLTFTHGRRKQIAGERQILAATGETLTGFSPTDSVVLDVGPPGSWDERRVYGASWLKRQDGEYLTPLKVNGQYRLYYSGHALNDGEGVENLGLTGLATYDSIPSV